MKFVSLDGKTYSKDLTKYRFISKSNSPSIIQGELGEILVGIWPNMTIYEEVPISENMRLDFLMPLFRIAIEIDGKQHNEYVPFFHGNRFGYLGSIKRDVIKEEWCKINNIKLIRIKENQLKQEIVRKLINE